MTELDSWLKQATRRLSNEAAAQVRAEIQDHYESARELAMSSGASAEDAHRFAVESLGDANATNGQYRKVLLTSAEARMLREGNSEARTVCSRPWLKRLLRAIPVTLLLAATVSYLAGELAFARVLLAGGLGMGVLFAAPFLPVYTPPRARIVRWVKWIVLLGMLAMAFGPDVLKSSYLLFSCLWPLAWIEWTRISIRRKLPVAEWPKQLYL